MTGPVEYPAFRFVESERAQQLKNSRGGEKSRLHLLNYEEVLGKDRYAVAAEIITFKEGEERKLGWWDRKFNVLHEHVNEDGISTWYKINKNSLEKRLGISSEELGLNEDTGVVGKELEELVKAKQKNIDELNEFAKPQNDFERRFVRGLAEVGITPLSFQEIHFFPITHENDRIQTEEIKNLLSRPDSHIGLVVPYLENDSSWFSNLGIKKLGPIMQMVVDHSSYEKILSGELIPDKVLKPLNTPLGLPKGKIQFQIQGREVEHEFNSKTRPSEIKSWISELNDVEGVRVLLNTDQPGKYRLFYFSELKTFQIHSYQPILFFIQQARLSDDIVDKS